MQFALDMELQWRRIEPGNPLEAVALLPAVRSLENANSLSMFRDAVALGAQEARVLVDGTIVASTRQGIAIIPPDSKPRVVVPGWLFGHAPDKDVVRVSADLNGSLIAYTGNAMYLGGRYGSWLPSAQKLWFSEIIAVDDALIAAVPSAGATGLAGWEPPGLYWSFDGGLSWERMSEISSYFAVAAFADKTIVAAGERGIELRSERGQIRSVHGLHLSWETPAVSIIVIDPCTLLIAISSRDKIDNGGSGVYRSTDRGVTWAQVNGGIGGVGCIHSLFRYGLDHLVAITDAGIYQAGIVAPSVPDTSILPPPRLSCE